MVLVVYVGESDARYAVENPVQSYLLPRISLMDSIEKLSVQSISLTLSVPYRQTFANSGYAAGSTGCTVNEPTALNAVSFHALPLR